MLENAVFESETREVLTNFLFSGLTPATQYRRWSKFRKNTNTAKKHENGKPKAKVKVEPGKDKYCAVVAKLPQGDAATLYLLRRLEEVSLKLELEDSKEAQALQSDALG